MADIPESTKSVTASLWLEQAEQHNPILPTPGSPMAAAVAEEMEEYADRKLADFLATRAAPPAIDREVVDDVDIIKFANQFYDPTDNGYGADTRKWIKAVRAALSTLSADAIRQGEAVDHWKDMGLAPRHDGAKIIGYDAKWGVAEMMLDGAKRWVLAAFNGQVIYCNPLKWQPMPATPASHASDGGKA